MGQMSKKPNKFFKIRSPKVEIRWNRWLIYGCEVLDGDLQKDIWVSILLPKYRYYIDTYFLRYFPSLDNWVTDYYQQEVLILLNAIFLTYNKFEVKKVVHNVYFLSIWILGHMTENTLYRLQLICWSRQQMDYQIYLQIRNPVGTIDIINYIWADN